MTMLPEFKGFPKIPRLNREVIITEKIDGTCSLIYISDDLQTFLTGSRTRWITPGKTTDNYGFSAWAHSNKEELMKLGPGYHYGEWWGCGIQRGYGLLPGERRFSLFNTHRWSDSEVRPKCCEVVPVLATGPNIGVVVALALDTLKRHGSEVQPGFLDPEGIVIFHTAGSHLYKVTLKNDESPKGGIAWSEIRRTAS